jgi:ABC-type dipeptide/oligopeptide/nickel transport system permease subunit
VSAVAVAAGTAGTARAGRPRRVPIGIGVSAGFVLIVIGAAIVGPHLVAAAANNLDPLAQGTAPSAAHWLGTDDLGRDVAARVVAGAGAALLGPFVIAFSGLVISALLGIAAGYLGGLVDTITMRVVDFMFALPALLLTIVIVTVVRGGYWIAVLVIAVLNVQGDLRLVRGATLEQRALPYVEAGRVSGFSPARVMYRHIARNILPILLADFAVDFSGALVALAGLAFLGLGAPPGTPDWGTMLTEGQTVLLENPFAALGPGLAIIALAVSVNLIGDWLYERRAVAAERR